MKKRFLLLSMIGPLALSLVVQEPLSGQIGLQEVTSLRFQGNREFSDQVLANSIITRETECRSFLFQLIPFCLAGADFSLDPHFLNEREFRRDHARVRLWYYQRGFRETVVDTILDRSREDEVRITFRIQEGEPIRVTEVGFQGLEEVADSSIVQDLPIRVGEPFSLVALDASQDSLEARFRNSGYAHVDVLRRAFIPREAPYEAQVTFELYPGPLTRFGPLTVDLLPMIEGGEVSVDEAVVRRMLPFREGDVYQENLRYAGQRNLYNLDLFRFVEVQEDEVQDEVQALDSVLPLTIQVQEDHVHRVRTGGGLSTAECFNVEARWSSLNFFGGARRLQLTGRLSNIGAKSSSSSILCPEVEEGGEEYQKLMGLVSLEFTQPWLFSPRNSVAASLFLERRSVPQAFVREAIGMNLGVTRTLDVSTHLGVSLRPEYSSLSAAEVFFCSAYLICSPDEIKFLQDPNTLSPVALSFSHDRRNQALSPTRGYSAAVDLEYAGAFTGSDFRYTRVLSDATVHTQSRSGLVVGARLRGGWVSRGGFHGSGRDGASPGIIHPEKRLYAGGANSVRGFGQNLLGPKVLYLDDVSKLYDPDTGPCSTGEVEDLSCDAGELNDERFFPSPTGGTRLLEGSLELRFPLAWQLWEGATFVDFGQVWDDEANPRLRDLEFTPGLGVRFFSPIGPIRVDLGYRFGRGQELPVVTKKIQVLSGQTEPTVLDDLVVLDKRYLWGDEWGLSRLQFHFSIGQAF